MSLCTTVALQLAEAKDLTLKAKDSKFILDDTPRTKAKDNNTGVVLYLLLYLLALVLLLLPLMLQLPLLLVLH